MLPRQPILVITSPPYDAPLDLSALMAQASAAPFEGVWIPVGYAKVASVEVEGTFSGLSVQLIGSNSIEPPDNKSTVTIGGSVTADDVVTLTFTNPLLPAGSTTAHYTVLSGDTTTLIAAGVAAAINANPLLAALGIRGAGALAVVTVAYPSTSPNEAPEGSSPTAPSSQNSTLITGAVSGAATETVTVANASVGQNVGAALIAKGLTQLAITPRWLKAQIGTLNGGSATDPVTVSYHGAA